MLERVAVSPSRTFLALALAFIAGIGTHAIDETPRRAAAIAVLAALAALLLAAAAGRRTRPRLLLLSAAFFLFAWARYDAGLAEARPPADPPAGTPAFTGLVADEPRSGPTDTILVMDRVFFYDGGRYAPLGERVSLTAGAGLAAGYGSRLAWTCRLGAVSAGLALPGRQPAWSCYGRDAAVVGPAARLDRWKAALFAFRSRLRELSGRLLPEPESSLLLGLLIGDRSGLPDRLVAAFRLSGTSHILAVSGYNVTKVAEIVLTACACVAVRRRTAAVVAAASLTGFAVLTGGQASVVRAAAMGGLSLLAILCGRRYNAPAALTAAAAVMLALDPRLLRHDVGFQLSFAAVCGLHFFGPAFTRRLTLLPEAGGLRRTAGETLAATLATLPLILCIFGYLPLIGPLANLVILPLIPWAMCFGALSLALGALLPAAGLPAAWLAGLSLRAIIGAASLASLSPLGLTIKPGPAATAALFGWLGLLWYALARARPTTVRLFRKRPPVDIIIEDP